MDRVEFPDVLVLSEILYNDISKQNNKYLKLLSPFFSVKQLQYVLRSLTILRGLGISSIIVTTFHMGES